MRTKLLVVISSIIIYGFFLNSCSDDGVSTPLNNVQLEQEIDKICDSIITNTQLSGMIIGVWDKTNNLNYSKGFGLANKSKSTPMTTDLLFRIGSNTKSFVITRILQLVDENKLSLYDKLSKYFPDFPKSDLITIKMLCDMTSGIYNYTETIEFDNVVANDNLHKWTLEEVLNIAKNYEFYFEPGQGLHYSNTNTIILGGIIEIIDKEPLHQVLKDKIFEKYGLNKTYYPTDHKMPYTPYVSGYANFNDSTKFVDDVSEMFDVSWAGAAGAIVSDLNDVKKWVTLLIDGGMISDSLQAQRFDGRFFPGNSAKYAQGIFTYEGTNMWGHNGGLPGYTSIMMRDKNMDRTIVIFYNIQGNTTPEELFLRIESLLRNWKS